MLAIASVHFQTLLHRKPEPFDFDNLFFLRDISPKGDADALTPTCSGLSRPLG